MTDAPSDIVLSAAPAPGPGKAGRHQVIASRGDAEFYRDTIDLNSGTSRKRYLGAVMRAAFRDVPADDWPDGVRDALADKLLAFARVPPGSPAPPPDAAPEYVDPRLAPLADTPDDVRAEADALLADPRLLERVAADIEAAGVIGEKALAATLYLVAVSAQLPKPLAAIVRGASSSGKSYTVDRVFALAPPEVVLNATSLTANALYYFPPGTLRHRVVVAGERSRVEDDDKAEATRALREMIEAGRLTKAVPLKDEGGRLVTRVIEQEGPVAYVETTTLGEVFEEDRNRCLLLATDEREEQTRRILAATADRAAGGGAADARRAAVHHCLHRLLPRCDVTVPFAPAAAARFPAGRVEARRDFRHLLQLVRASALLHHRQRGRDGAGNVVAAPADYQVAERLARGPLGAAASGVGEAARDYLAVLRAKFDRSEFSTADAQKVGAGSRRSKYGRLAELNAAGMVEQVHPAKGKVPAVWKVTGSECGDGTGVVPSVHDVCGPPPPGGTRARGT